MRVRLLGTGSADGWPNPFCDCRSCATERAAGRARRPSSALVDDVLLIDCGPTTPHLPADAGCTLGGVEHVLITHGHPDHLHPAFLLTRRWTGPDRVLHVWGPPLAIDMCRDWIGPDSAVELHVVAPGDALDLGTARGAYAVEVLAARHAHGDGDAVAAEALLYAVTGPDDARLLYATDTGPFDPAETRLPVDPFDVVLLDGTFGDVSDHGTGHLDLATLPGVLDALRLHGSLADDTVVVATHLSHHNPPTAELRERVRSLGVRVLDDFDVIDTAQGARGRRILVLGGARSGKSHHAEHLVGDRSDVVYVATGGERPGDTEWAERVRHHRDRRPGHWRTLETVDVATILRTAEYGGTVLVDCLALWLTAHLDAAGAWERIESGDAAGVQADVLAGVDELVAAVRGCRADVVLVSNEVGMGVVPATSSGRAFRDLLGITNVRVAEACDETVLVVAGQPLPLTAGHRAH
jgi:adenosylcobinamide kinase / adenosylcobinamide-phosphate guanylyltransferase